VPQPIFICIKSSDIHLVYLEVLIVGGKDSVEGKEPNKIGVGLVLGIGIGVAIGVAMDNIALGIGIGVAIGVAMGAAWNNQARKDADNQDGE
jgi:hypothetical protein